MQQLVDGSPGRGACPADVEALALKSAKLLTPASLRATTVKGSGYSENTERRSVYGPASLNSRRPFTALYCMSDWTMLRVSWPALMALIFPIESPLNSTEQCRPGWLWPLLTTWQMAVPVAW